MCSRPKRRNVDRPRRKGRLVLTRKHRDEQSAFATNDEFDVEARDVERGAGAAVAVIEAFGVTCDARPYRPGRSSTYRLYKRTAFVLAHAVPQYLENPCSGSSGVLDTLSHDVAQHKSQPWRLNAWRMSEAVPYAYRIRCSDARLLQQHTQLPHALVQEILAYAPDWRAPAHEIGQIEVHFTDFSFGYMLSGFAGFDEMLQVSVKTYFGTQVTVRVLNSLTGELERLDIDHVDWLKGDLDWFYEDSERLKNDREIWTRLHWCVWPRLVFTRPNGPVYHLLPARRQVEVTHEVDKEASHNVLVAWQPSRWLRERGEPWLRIHIGCGVRFVWFEPFCK